MAVMFQALLKMIFFLLFLLLKAYGSDLHPFRAFFYKYVGALTCSCPSPDGSHEFRQFGSTVSSEFHGNHPDRTGIKVTVAQALVT